MKISDQGIGLIKTHEGCKLTAYRDSTGVLTIGYGHTGPDVAEYTIWTQEEAEHALIADVGRFEACVSAYAKEPMTQGQFDALVSFAYNLGCKTLANSTLLRKFNAGDIDGAAEEFGKWIHAGGQVLNGLVARRADERATFLA